MKTIPEIVEIIIKNQVFVEEALVDEILNLSAFARKIKPEIEANLRKEVQLGAVVMALKRHVPMSNMQLELKIKRAVNNFGDIIVRSSLENFTYSNSKSLIKNQTKLLEIVSEKNDVFYAISQGMNETTIVINSSFNKLIDKIFQKEFLISRTNNLSSVTIKLPNNNANIPGLYYFILKGIAWEGISIIEIVSTTNEFTIIVDDNDVEQVFSIIKKLNKNNLTA